MRPCSLGHHTVQPACCQPSLNSAWPNPTGIDKIGVSIEEPFSILALEAISGTALANVRELAAMHDSVDSALGAAGAPGSAANGTGPGTNGHATPDVSAATMVAMAVA